MKYLALILAFLTFSQPTQAGFFDKFKEFFNKPTPEKTEEVKPVENEKNVEILAEEADTEVLTEEHAKKIDELKAKKEKLEDKLSIRKLHQRAEDGDARAQFLLGEMYRIGSEKYDLAKDGKEATKWYKLAAEQGDAKAQYHTGFMYYNGEGIEQNYDEAFKWFKKAADQGHASAQYNVATMYKTGNGVKQDDKEAFAWLKKSAEQQYLYGMLGLATVYESGQIVPQDFTQTYLWLSLVIEKGMDQVKPYLEAIIEKMTPEQIEEGKKLFEEYNKKSKK